jgi:hypothetical protein
MFVTATTLGESNFMGSGAPTHGDLHGKNDDSVVDQVSSEGMAPDLHEGLHCQQPWISERWINMGLLKNWLQQQLQSQLENREVIMMGTVIAKIKYNCQI